MSKNSLNYEAIFWASNNAKARLDFHGGSAGLAEAHVQHILNTAPFDMLEWQSEPTGEIIVVNFRKKGADFWKTICKEDK